MLITSPAVPILRDGDFDENSPIAAWRNRVTTANVTTTTQDASYPTTNLANPATHLKWKGTSTSAETIVITPGGANAIDYIAFARHNFATAGRTVKVEGATDGVPTYSELIAAQSIANDAPLILRLKSDNYTHLRVTLGAGAIPQAAVLYCGDLMLFQRRVYVGHSPLSLSRRTNTPVGLSGGGEYLGRVIIGENVESNISLNNLTAAWYRSYMDPFVVNCKEYPFFFAWRPTSYPLEVAYCWLKQDPIPNNTRSNGMMSVELSVQGIIG